MPTGQASRCPTEAEWQRADIRRLLSGRSGSCPGSGTTECQFGNLFCTVGSACGGTRFLQVRGAFGIKLLGENGWEWDFHAVRPSPDCNRIPFLPGLFRRFFDGKAFSSEGWIRRTAACMLRRSFRTGDKSSHIISNSYTGFRCGKAAQPLLVVHRRSRHARHAITPKHRL